MSDKPVIQTPMKLQLQRIRYQIVPVFTLFVACLLTGWMIVKRGTTSQGVGEVFGPRVEVSARINGTLGETVRRFSVFDTVTQGEVVARLDRSLIDAQMATLQKQIDTESAELAKVNAERKRLKDSGKDDSTAVALLIQAENRLLPSLESNTVKIQELQAQIALMEIKAPISGTIMEITRFPGQSIQAGQTIMIIAASKADYVVSYVRQNQAIQPTAGMTVELRVRPTMRSYRTSVLSVGPTLELVPPQQLRDQRVLEWGIPVHVKIPKELTTLKPGELVDVAFLAEGSSAPGGI